MFIVGLGVHLIFNVDNVCMWQGIQKNKTILFSMQEISDNIKKWHFASWWKATVGVPAP